MTAKKKAGVFLILAAGVLSIIACAFYTRVMYTLPAVYILMIALAAICGASFFTDNAVLTKVAPVITAILAANAIIWGANPMVNQIGYVVAGLDEMSTIINLIISMGIMLAVMLLSIVSSFMKQKEK